MAPFFAFCSTQAWSFLRYAPRQCDFKPPSEAPAHHPLVHEDAVVVEVDFAQREWEKPPSSVYRIEHQGAVAREHRNALVQPDATSVSTRG